MIYIYTLSHPITNEVRYVGKTKNVLRRFKQHLYDKRGSHKASWVKSLKSQGMKPILNVIEVCTIDNWAEREIYWISQYNNLTNLKKGGNDSYTRTTTEETKQKLSLAHKGKKFTDDHKENIRKSCSNKIIIIDNIEYYCKNDAAKALNLTLYQVDARLRSKNYPNYKILTKI